MERGVLVGRRRERKNRTQGQKLTEFLLLAKRGLGLLHAKS